MGPFSLELLANRGISFIAVTGRAFSSLLGVWRRSIYSAKPFTPDKRTQSIVDQAASNVPSFISSSPLDPNRLLLSPSLLILAPSASVSCGALDVRAQS